MAHAPRHGTDDRRRGADALEPLSRWWACRSTRLSRSRRCRTELRDRALLESAADGRSAWAGSVSRCAVSTRTTRSRTRSSLLYGQAADGGVDRWPTRSLADLYGRAGAVIDIDLAGMTEDQSISTLLGSAPGLIGSDRSLPLHELRRSPVAGRRSCAASTRCAISIRDTIAEALERGSFTDAMGRSMPLGAAMVMLTAPGIDDAALLEPVLGPPLIGAATLVTGAAGTLDATDQESWIRREILDPLAGRFARQGYTIAFDPAFVNWVAAHNTDGPASIANFVDQTVTPALAAALPTERGSFVVTLNGETPIFEPRRE